MIDLGQQGRFGQDVEVFAWPRWRQVLDISLLAMLFAGLAALAWYLAPVCTDPELLGQLILLLLLSPMFLAWTIAGALEAGRHIRSLLTRYGLSADGLTARGLLSRRYVRWDEVRQCELPASAGFGPPDRMVLRSGAGQELVVPLNLNQPDKLRARFEALLPMLGPGDTRRVRLARCASPAHARREKRERRLAALGMVYFLGIFNLMAAVLVAVSAIDYCNYWRITADPVDVAGLVSRVRKGDKMDSAFISYTVADERLNAWRFVTCRRLNQGDQVIVQYLRGSPRVARIKDLDLDSRQVGWLLLSLILMAFYLKVVRVVWRGLTRPAEQRLTWGLVECDGKWTAAVGPHRMETNCAAWPDRHDGWLVLRSVRLAGQQDDLTAAQLQKRLRKGGIEAEVIAKEFLLLTPEQAGTLFGWLGREPRQRATYWVLACDDADAARQFILDYLARKPKAENLRPLDESFWKAVRFFCSRNTVGPFERREIGLDFQQFLQAGLARLEYLENCPGLLEAGLAPVFRSLERAICGPAPAGSVQGCLVFTGRRGWPAKPKHLLTLAIRRDRNCRIVARRKDAGLAEQFTLDNGQWRQ